MVEGGTNAWKFYGSGMESIAATRYIRFVHEIRTAVLLVEPL